MLHLIGVDKGFTRPRLVSVLSGVHLAVPRGQAVCISGAVGAGKTTLIRLAAGEMFADTGEVRVLGQDPARLRSTSLAALRRLIAWIPQELRLLNQRTALDNAMLGGEAAGLSRKDARAKAAGALADVGLVEEVDVPVYALSSGQRRRVSIARGLCSEPQLILADEPTGDLDTEGVSLLAAALDRHMAGGATVVLTTHDRRLLDAAASRGWGHFRLVGGHLESAREIEIRRAQSGVIVPFPQVARVGGIE